MTNAKGDQLKMQIHVAPASSSSQFLPNLRRTQPLAVKRSPRQVRCCSLKRQNTNTTTSNKSIWLPISVSLSSTGFFLGPIIDGLHSRVNLVTYKNGSVDIGPLHTNIWVPVLLGLFYTTVGLLQLWLDERDSSLSASEESLKQKTTASLVALVLFIELSAELYKARVADNIEAYILFGAAELIWYLVDRTWSGFALASLVGLACPLAEVPLMKYFSLWYYPQSNVEIFGQGLVTWTITCYFVYTTFLINLSRWIKSVITLIDIEGTQGP